MLCLWICCIESMVLTSSSALHLLYDIYHLATNVKSNTFICTLIDKYIFFLRLHIHVCVALVAGSLPGPPSCHCSGLLMWTRYQPVCHNPAMKLQMHSIVTAQAVQVFEHQCSGSHPVQLALYQPSHLHGSKSKYSFLHCSTGIKLTASLWSLKFI